MRLKVTLAAALLACAGFVSAASQPGPRTDEEINKSVNHAVLMYPRYTMWDDIQFRASNGQVELSGAVTQPYKKSDLVRIVQRIPGVTAVTDDIRVLPLSPMDDRLRLQVARAIYRDSVLSRYAGMAIAPIHIIVENGHVTLDGWVLNNLEKQVAGVRANSAGLSFGQVVNNLQVEHPSKKS